MKQWFWKLRTQPKLQNGILLVLFIMLFILPEQSIYTDIGYVVILSLISYISKYIHIAPVWKGLLYSICVTAIIVFVFLTILGLFPNIPYVLLIVIMAAVAGLSIHLIGESKSVKNRYGYRVRVRRRNYLS